MLTTTSELTCLKSSPSPWYRPSPAVLDTESPKEYLVGESGGETVKAAKIMIVDDEAFNVMVWQKHLQAFGYRHFLSTTDATMALPIIRHDPPALVLLDVLMPQVSGLEILQELRSDPNLKYIPVIILTASSEPEIKQRALELEATDFLSKPVDRHELVLRVRNALLVKSYQDHLSTYAQRLERDVERRTAELAMSREQLIFCLARAAEFRDNETGNHILRVGRFVGVIARELGFGEAEVAILEQAARLHDVGKIGIPDEILRKPGKLDPDEYELMQKHCSYGRKIISRMPDHEWEILKEHPETGARMLDIPASPILAVAAVIALTHHERWDGKGYPLGLAGEDIPIEGRMTAVADVYDALSAKRSYKQPIAREECFAIMHEARGRHFDPHVLDAFFQRREEIVEVQIECADLA